MGQIKPGEETHHLLGFDLVQLNVVKHLNALGSRLVGKERQKSQPLHPFWHRRAILSRFWAKNRSAATPQGGTNSSGPGAPGPFLAPGLSAAAVNLTPGFSRRVSCSLPSEVVHNVLVYDRLVGFNFKHFRLQINRPDFLTFLIVDSDVHYQHLPLRAIRRTHLNQRTFVARYGSFDEQQVFLLDYLYDFQIDNGDLFFSHATRHPHALENTRGIR